jgi:hypothetical protein
VPSRSNESNFHINEKKLDALFQLLKISFHLDVKIRKLFFKNQYYFMRLKAISPFIASVLLIGFTISTGIILYYFVTTLPRVQTTEVSSQASRVLSCAGATFDVKVRNCNLLNGLVLWLPMDEGSGTIAYDYSGYGNNGTLYNGTNICSNPPNSGCPTWVDGKIGRALSFDGVNDYVDIPCIPQYELVGSFSVAAWAKPQENTWRLGIVTTRFYYGSAGTFYFSLGFAFTRGAYLFLTNGTHSLINSECLTPITLDNWYYLVASVDPTNATLYIFNSSGLQKACSWSYNSLPVFTKCPNSIKLARAIDWEGPKKSTIDEVRIYNRALSEDEIKELYYNGLTNKFNITIGLLNFGYADLGKKFYCYCLFKEWNNFTTAFNFR